MAKEARLKKIDVALLARVSALSPGGQRWLRTALHAISTAEALWAALEEAPRYPPRPAPGQEKKRLPKPRPASLEEVISGQADLREQLEAYPELAEELEGLADIIDMLREAGEARRRRGEQILREEILGQPETGPEDETLA